MTLRSRDGTRPEPVEDDGLLRFRIEHEMADPEVQAAIDRRIAEFPRDFASIRQLTGLGSSDAIRLLVWQCAARQDLPRVRARAIMMAETKPGSAARARL